MNKLKKGDEIIVITGKDKNKKGTITEILKNGQYLLIDGINTVKKHVKPNPNTNERGGVVIKSNPIHVSNVMLHNSDKQKGSRVGIKILDNGSKVRYYKLTNEIVDVQV